MKPLRDQAAITLKAAIFGLTQACVGSRCLPRRRAAVWPFALADPWVAYPLLFVRGGAFAGIYNNMLTVVGSRFQGAEQISLYATLSVVRGSGALLGPLLGGAAMHLTVHGLPFFAAVSCAALALFMLASRSKA